MNRKLHRVLDEIQKTEEKIAAWQEQLENLNTQREMLEDAEIIKSIRSMNLERRELLAVLEGLQNGEIVIAENSGAIERPGGDGNMESMDRPGDADSTGMETAEGMVPENRAMESEGLDNEEEN